MTTIKTRHPICEVNRFVMAEIPKDGGLPNDMTLIIDDDMPSGVYGYAYNPEIDSVPIEITNPNFKVCVLHSIAG